MRLELETINSDEKIVDMMAAEEPLLVDGDSYHNPTWLVKMIFFTESAKAKTGIFLINDKVTLYK